MNFDILILWSAMQTKFKTVTLKNSKGMQVVICNYGARILSIKVPNKNGVLTETVLNHHEEHKLVADEAYLGATCGRVANRIAGARFRLGGYIYKLDKNEGENTLHGGVKAFDKQYWQMRKINSSFVSLEYLSIDGENGFPGNLRTLVRYTLEDNNTLSISFDAQSDKPCPVNLCNHSYFHLGEPNIYQLTLQVRARKYLPVDDQSIPTGSLSDLPPCMDLNSPVLLTDTLAETELDHCYVVNTPSSTTLSSAKTGIQLTIESDQLGMQIYSGKYLPQPHRAIALEAQGLIDAVNQPNFESDIISPEASYSKVVRYHFDIV